MSTVWARYGLPVLALGWLLAHEAHFASIGREIVPDWLWGLGLIALGAGSAIAWWEDYFRPRLIWPDFGKWDGADKFELKDAAALWLNIEPRPLPMSRRVTAAFEMLRGVIREKQLPMRADLDDSVSMAAITMDGRENPYDVHMPVTRVTLVKVAELRGEKPKFLFRSERHKRFP